MNEEEIKKGEYGNKLPRKKRWNPDEIQWLKDNYEYYTDAQLSQKFNRSKKSVEVMRGRLGLNYYDKKDIRKELMKGSRTLTDSQILSEFRLIYGDKYDYSKMDYKGHHTEILIICPIHGEFYRTPMMHKRGYGCPKCSKEENLIYGVGISDMPSIKEYRSYQTWISMLERCYGDSEKYVNTYKFCSVCEEWLRFSNFNSWFENPKNGYIDGYALDKDIIVKGNKVYSPDTCCFVPISINSMICRGAHKNREYPIGVIKCESGRFRATFQQKSLGMFDTPEEAFYTYKQAKESNVKKVAQEYYDRGEITKKVYDALMRYEIEITD